AEGTVSLSDLAGKVAGTDVAGRLAIGLGQPTTMDGDLELGEIDFPAVLATATGVPARGPAAAAVWPAEPFEQGLIGQVVGRIAVKSAHVSLTPKLATKKVRGVVRFDQSTLRVDEIDGTLAGGRIAGDLAFARGPDGITMRSPLRLAGADLAKMGGGGPPPLS